MPMGKRKAGPGKGSKTDRKAGQMFLDLGQRGFGASRCPVCGMLYAKGHDEDEKLHRSFHLPAVQGLKFQGWVQQRVLLSEPFQGKLLMVVMTDPVSQLKKVQELCAFVEKAHGVVPGWLLSAPHCKVFLYASVQKRVIGLAVVEPIKQAYRIAAADPDDCEAALKEQQQQESHTQSQQQQQPGLGLTTVARVSMPGSSGASRGDTTTMPPPQCKQQQQQPKQQLFWPGLHTSSRRAAGLIRQTRCSSGGFTSRLSGMRCQDSATTAGVSNSAVKADSCPTSFLAVADNLHVNASSSSLLGHTGVAQDTLEIGSQMQNQQPKQQQRQRDTVQQQQMLGLQQHESNVLHAVPQSCSNGRDNGNSLASQSVLPHPGASVAGCSTGAAQTSRWPRATSNNTHGNSTSSSWQFSRQGGGADVVIGGTMACMVADKRKAVRAMLGVRMVWVSAEQRRNGLATKLLDAARCNMIPGYVVPRNQLAFTQLSAEGARLAAGFTGTPRFMVYGIE